MTLLGAVASGQGTEAKPAPPSPQAAPDYSGMYTFLRDGEFVQITVEERGQVTGFISRYGDLDSDKGAFLDQFFKTGTLDANRLAFTTQTVHGVWFEFKGSVDRGEGKTRGDESYYELRGTLVQNVTDAENKTSSRSRDVVFKSFPQDLGAQTGKKN